MMGGHCNPEPPRIVRADLPRPSRPQPSGDAPADRLLDPDPAHRNPISGVNFDYGDAPPSTTSTLAGPAAATLTCPVSALLPTAPLRRVPSRTSSSDDRPAGDHLGQRVGCDRADAIARAAHISFPSERLGADVRKDRVTDPHPNPLREAGGLGS